MKPSLFEKSLLRCAEDLFKTTVYLRDPAVRALIKDPVVTALMDALRALHTMVQERQAAGDSLTRLLTNLQAF